MPQLDTSEMAASSLVLLFLTVPAYSSVFQPRLTRTDVAGLDRTGPRGEETMESWIAADSRREEREVAEEGRRDKRRAAPFRWTLGKDIDGLMPELEGRREESRTQETRSSLEVRGDFRGSGKKTTQEKMKTDLVAQRKDGGEMDTVSQEERESRLVAGLHLQDVTGGREMEGGQWKDVNRVLSTFTAQLEVTSSPPGDHLDGRVTATPPPGGSSSTPASSAQVVEDLPPELVHGRHEEEDLTVRMGNAATTGPVVESTVTRDPITRAETGTRSGLTSPRTPLMTPLKVSRGSHNKMAKASRLKVKNKIQQFDGAMNATFPYFTDDYCPPECTCYGRVVQCSDRHVDKVPYGIPFNSRYILLMNNDIDGIQLDLLKEYSALEFLVLSNNRLTDAAIEGVFDGVPALKRLYLDKNLLVSVPADLPVSLEELRLENNQLSVMSDAAWSRCPGLLVLSLSNNSLGSGSGSLPKAALRPLSHLRTLNLDHNHLTSVPLGLPLSVKELYLKGNHIGEFREGSFNGPSQLVLLDLSANRLTNKGLPRDALTNTTRLESLNLEGNRLKQVPRHLPLSLKTLNLEGNLISSVNKKSFNNLKNLEHLSLSRNKILKVAPGAFKALSALHQLDLRYNALTHVPRQLPPGLHWVTLTHNKIHTVSPDAFCWGNFSLSGLIQVQLEHNLIDMARLNSKAFRCLRGPQIVRFY